MPDEIEGQPNGHFVDNEVVLSPRNLRGIAHPVRVRLLGLLRIEGPSTATRLAERLGLNNGATSYHLRQLELYGFVVEDKGRGNARERWWCAAHHRTSFESAALLNGEAGELAETYLSSVAAAYAEATQRAIEERQALPAQWRGLEMLSDLTLRLTPDEVQQLMGEVLEAAARYRPDDDENPPADSAPVRFQVQAFPLPGVLPLEDG